MLTFLQRISISTGSFQNAFNIPTNSQLPPSNLEAQSTTWTLFPSFGSVWTG